MAIVLGIISLVAVLLILVILYVIVLQKTRDVRCVVTVECSARVVAEGTLEGVEEVFVVDDVAVLLVVTVEAVDAADGLEQTMVLHLLVDIEVGG